MCVTISLGISYKLVDLYKYQINNSAFVPLAHKYNHEI